jgi:hypothetical protein
MNQKATNSWILAAICAVSLAGYLCFSAGLRYWLSSWDYFRALYNGLSSLPDPLWIQLWKRLFSGIPWDLRQLTLLASLLALSFLVSFLAWRNMRGRINFVLSLSLFLPACLIVPQILLALLFWPDGHRRVIYANHMAILGLAAAGMFIFSLIRPGANPVKNNQEASERIGVWGIAFMVPAATVLFTALLLGIGYDPGYDAGAYHLPLAAGYGISGNIMVRHDIPFTYPSNGELLLRWFLFPGNDRLASLPSFLVALLIAAILYNLCRCLALERQPALIAACASVTFPVFPYLASIPNSDLVGIAAMLMSLIFLIGMYRTGCAEPVSICCFGLALGLAAGARLSLLPSCAFMVLALFIVMCRSEYCHFPSPDARLHWSRIVLILLTISFFALIGGCFWYLRNALIHGNPFFPISMLGMPGMPIDSISPVVGVMHDKPWLIALYPWTELGYTYIYDTGVGAVFTAIVLPGLLWWPVSMICNWKAEEGKCRFERMLAYLCVVSCFVYFVSRPSVYTRHAAFGILLSFFLVAEMWKRLRKPIFRAVVFLAFLVMCFSLEKSLAGAILYRLAIPAREGAARFGLPAAIDTLPPARIFNAAAGYLTYGCMGRDYRHEVLTLFRQARAQDIREARADYLLIRAEQKPLFETGLSLELVAEAAAANARESLLLYRVLPP